MNDTKPRRTPRGTPRRLVMTFGVGLFVVVAGGLLLGRMKVKHFVQSPEFRDYLQQTVNGGLKGRTPALVVNLPEVRWNGFFDLEMVPIRLESPSQPVKPQTLGLRVRAEGFARGLLGKPIRFEGVLAAVNPGEGPPGSSSPVSSQNTITVRNEIPLTTLLRLAATWSPGTSNPLVTQEIVPGTTIELQRLDSHRWAGLWLAAQGPWPRMELVSGEVSGLVRIVRPGSPSAQGLKKEVRLDLSRTQWETPLFRRMKLETEPLSLNATLEDGIFTLTDPLAVTVTVKLAPGAGSPQDLGSIFLVGKTGLIDRPWTLTLTNSVSSKEGAARYDLKARVKGGPLALLAVGRLFRCKTPPLRDEFQILGPVHQPACS